MNKDFGTGALKEVLDSRSIQLESFQLPISIPPSFKTDISMLAADNQGARGSCTWNALTKAMQLINYWDTKVVRDLSWRFGYGITKGLDGMPDVEGTFISLALKVGHDVGTTNSNDVANDIDLAHREFINVPRTPEIFQNAYEQKIKGYAEVAINPVSIKQAIFQNGFVIAGIAVGVDLYTLPLKPMPFYGWHALFFFGYEDLQDGSTDFFYLNSWGKNWGVNGVGRINTKDYFVLSGTYFNSIYTITDIPQILIDEAKRKAYRPSRAFNRELRRGMNNEDIRILQDILKYEGCLDITQVPVSTTFYGPKTSEAVLKFQQRYNVAPNSLLTQLEGDIVGPATLAVLNKFYAPTTTMLDKWCLAIQKREGYFSPGQNPNYPNGTPSWRNKNPGNLKYVGQKKAVGQAGPFCIFATYQDGYDELKSLLTRAATTGIGRYYPTMTLLQFYHVYAPTEDQNDPASYAYYVAKALKVDVTTKIKELLK
jgi:hypothetical protein